MRFLLSILGVVLFIVVVIVIIASGNAKSKTTQRINLDKYDYSSSSVTQITTGQLVADSKRQAVKIVVSQKQVVIYLLSGYNNNVTADEAFANNSTSYGVFLGAMQNAGFAQSRKTNEINMFGVCPLGSTYQYQLNNGTKNVSNLWSTSCETSDGTMAGNGPLIRQLFALQIPNYSAFTQNENTIVY